MISKKFNCIFIHIPRTGGHSIHKAFKYSVKKPLVDNMGREIDHYRFIDYQETVHDFHKYLSFSFTRNPWAKALSEFVFLKHGTNMWPGASRNRSVNPGSMRFKEYLTSIKNLDFQKFNHFEKSHFIPQFYYLSNKNSKINVDFIGKFETLQKDFTFFVKKLKGQIPGLTHLNKRKARNHHYSRYYDQESIKLVESIYKIDIDTFDYSFKQV